MAVADQVRPDGTVLGARIVLNPATLARLDAAGRRLLISHELTHIASRSVTSDQMPTWLIEGLADYVGNLGSGMPVSRTAAELAAEVRAGGCRRRCRPTPTSPVAAGCPGLRAVLAGLPADRGPGRPGRSGALLPGGGRGRPHRPATAVAIGLREVLRTDLAAFTAAWRSYLIGQLR